MATPTPASGNARRDEAAFAAVVDAYQGRLLRYVARLLANPSPAEDIVQRVFIKCAAHWKGPMEPSDDLSAWLYRLAHNEAIDYVRRERRRGFLHLRHAEEREASGETVAPVASPLKLQRRRRVPFFVLSSNICGPALRKPV